ncbi:MAG: hypothetical protein AcusKO_45260 [Acuticoccus sp.]
MGKANFTEDFKRDAVVQITERGYPGCGGGGAAGGQQVLALRVEEAVRQACRRGPAMTSRPRRSAG